MEGLKAAIISLGSTSSKWTATAMEQYFEKVDLLNIKQIEITLGDEDKKTQVLYQGEPLEQYDCVYVKGSHNYAQVASAVTAYLSRTAYMPITSDAFFIAHDKLLTHIALQRARIPSPKTYVSATPLAAKGVLKNINYPIIMKFPHGTHGKGVMFAESFAAASSILDALVSLRQAFIIQEFVDTGGVDIRVIVAGGKVIAAMKRLAAGDEKRANVHAGATVQAFVPDRKIQKIAIDTAKALNCDICGVDLLEGPKGPLVIEANISPGLQGITRATGEDVAQMVAKALYEKTIEYKENKLVESKVSAQSLIEDSDEASQNQVQHIFMNVEFRGNRILLPEIISKMAKFEEDEEITFDVKKKHITMHK